MKLLHKKRVLRAFYYASRWRVKRLLCLPEEPNLHVVQSGSAAALARNRRICLTLLPYFQSIPDLHGGVAAEIGSGDCLGAADMALGIGARHVHLLDQRPIIISPHHKAIINSLATDKSLPNAGEILLHGEQATLNTHKATAHTGLLESVGLPEPADLIYSFDVLEHVEDLSGFFRRCREMSKAETVHVHKFDLSGHEFFEDPVDPLDFQTYPDWLFNTIFPRYRRAVGHMADEIFDALTANGCIIEQVVPLRTAEKDYLQRIKPRLRHKARQRDNQTLALLDVIVVARQT
ncbi:MAG: hypothetical protein RIQ71_293 [Verrucomicrobiota bacterium]|jgi:hypothetical protein